MASNGTGDSGEEEPFDFARRRGRVDGLEQTLSMSNVEDEDETVEELKMHLELCAKDNNNLKTEVGLPRRCCVNAIGNQSGKHLHRKNVVIKFEHFIGGKGNLKNSDVKPIINRSKAMITVFRWMMLFPSILDAVFTTPTRKKICNPRLGQLNRWLCR